MPPPVPYTPGAHVRKNNYCNYAIDDMLRAVTRVKPGRTRPPPDKVLAPSWPGAETLKSFQN